MDEFDIVLLDETKWDGPKYTLQDYKTMPSGWYSHSAYPVVEGKGSYVVFDKKLYEVHESGDIYPLRDDLIGLYTPGILIPMSVKFMYGPREGSKR